MRVSRTIAAYGWFAFGAWAGITGSQLADVLLGRPLKIRGMVDDGSMLQFMILVFVPGALLYAAPFAVWHWWRSKHRWAASPTLWPLPLVCGLIYFPALCAYMPLLCQIVGEGKGWRIGSCIMVYQFGMPVVFAESVVVEKSDIRISGSSELAFKGIVSIWSDPSETFVSCVS